MYETNPKSIAEIMAMATPDSGWLFPGRISKGLWFLEGGGIDHRTTLMMQIAKSIAAGKNLLGDGDDVTPRNVAYVTYSRTPEGVAAGFKKIGLDPDKLSKSIHIVTLNRLGIYDTDEVETFLEAGDVFLFDGVPIDGVPENMNQGTWFELVTLNLKQKYTVIVAPTLPMRGKKRDVACSLADGIIALAPDGESQALAISGRSIEASNMVFDGNHWVPVEFAGATIDQLDIVALLKGAGKEPIKLADMATKLDVKNDEKFRKRAHRLEARGVIRRVSHGVYQHPDNVPKQLGSK